MSQQIAGACPICGAVVTMMDIPLVGELVDCPECEGELEVTQVQPLQLVQAPEFKEDWGE